MGEEAVTEDPERRTSSRPVVIGARDLSRTFGSERALERLDLAIPQGSIYGFVGPSGSGKTTAVRLLVGIDTPTDGHAEVLGHPATSRDRGFRERIGYMPQQSVQFPNLTVQQNLNFVASLYGLPLRRRDLINEVLERVELSDHRRKRASDLSGGMRRRLALAAALVHRPEVLFLDEPTAGIDPVLRRSIWDYFDELRDGGSTLFVTTQYVNEAAYCDRVGVLSEGRLIADETPVDLRRKALGGDVLELEVASPLDREATEQLRALEGVRRLEDHEDAMRFRLVVDAADRQLPELQTWCAERDIEVESLREDQVAFDDVFASLMRSDDAGRDRHEPAGAR